MTATKRKTTRTTTEKGVGWKHQQQREILLRTLRDGTPCYWCARPLRREAEANWDGKALAADHTHARAKGGTKADRLLHSTCNGQRGEGDWDDQRPAASNIPPEDWSKTNIKKQRSHFQQVNIELV